MNNLKEIIIDKLKKNRPNITDSSIKTYVSNLVIHRKRRHVFTNKENFTFRTFIL